MTDPTLPLLLADATALLLLGAWGALLSRVVAGWAVTALTAFGALVSLAALLARAPPSSLSLPVGIPALEPHVAIDPLAAFFLFVTLLCGTAVAAFAAVAENRARTSWLARPDQPPAERRLPLGLAGVAIVLLAADTAALAIGLTLTCATLGWPTVPAAYPDLHRAWLALPVVLLLTALCLLSPADGSTAFAAMRHLPVDPGRATLLAGMAVLAGVALSRRTVAPPCRTTDALIAAALLPCASYLLIRCVIDLPAAAAPLWPGLALLLLGSAATIADGWQATRQADVRKAAASITRRLTGLAFIGLSLTLLARAADLPGAAAMGLAATLLLTLVGAPAGTLTCLAAHAIVQGAGSARLVRLGGLIHAMPVTSAALSAGLLTLSALPPGGGFAALWLLFQTLLSAPRTGGLLGQLPLALAATALALSSALATAATVRLVGIVVLSRPRGVRGSAAIDPGPAHRRILLALAGLAALIAILPGPMLTALALPALRDLTGAGLGGGWISLPAATLPNYTAIIVLALLLASIGAVILAARAIRPATRLAGLWDEGLEPSPALPFGDPLTQTMGDGFLPAPPIGRTTPASPPGTRAVIARLQTWLRATTWPIRALPPSRLGLCAMLLLLGATLLLLALSDGGVSR